MRLENAVLTSQCLLQVVCAALDGGAAGAPACAPVHVTCTTYMYKYMIVVQAIFS